MKRTPQTVILLLAAIILAAISVYTLRTTIAGSDQLPDRVYIEEMWTNYKKIFVHRDGYTFDQHNNGGEVTSEGQSYTLLRSVWMDDHETFKRALLWTDENLRRPDGLYAWQWTQENGGSVRDWNTATDADQDIAFALIQAALRFDHPAYLTQAKEIVQAIRTQTGIEIKDGWFPSAGNWAVRERIVNLSYFMPYEYAYFDLLDPAGGWIEVRDLGYELFRDLFADGRIQLPPDFIIVDPDKRMTAVPQATGLSSRFSYDAVRCYWRVALDCHLNQREEACGDPLRMFNFVGRLNDDGKIFSRYRTDGVPESDQISLSFYGALYPAIKWKYPIAADTLFAPELSQSRLSRVQKDKNRYYDLNWVWFGFAAELGLIKERTAPPEELKRLIHGEASE